MVLHKGHTLHIMLEFSFWLPSMTNTFLFICMGSMMLAYLIKDSCEEFYVYNILLSSYYLPTAKLLEEMEFYPYHNGT